MAEAIRQIKAELGPDAVILSTRQIRRGGGAFGLFGRSFVEVTAATNDAAITPERARAFARTLMERERTLREEGPPLRPRAETAEEAPARQPAAVEPGPPPRPEAPSVDAAAFQELRREVAELKALLCAFQARVSPGATPGGEGPLALLYGELRAQGVEEALARALIERLQGEAGLLRLDSPERARARLAQHLMAMIRIDDQLLGGPGMRRLAAFVGPTGVGKTTTIAKLAARAALEGRARVALVTLDTYRVAAVEQLRTYARILNLPVDVVTNGAELRRAVAAHSDKDVVLIDTAGRSPRDEGRMAELQEWLDAEPRPEVHLVVSATTQGSDLDEITRRFGALGVDRLLFTKLDEGTAFGGILNQAARTGLPISYFATGQRVPEDLELASAERLADLVLHLSRN
ncbi:MAG: flagellar biosynthesis protein FlhF [Deltaproteobacteria bacterium]|nr:flagellar biosynthesis protein FlhF [Deltaproteobacteria bacterium]